MQKKGGGKKSDAWIIVKVDWQTRNQTFFMSCNPLGEIAHISTRKRRRP
jgi:hypothetical protein